MAQFKDNYPYNIEAAQKLFIQYSHDIDFDYSTGKFPDGTESDWDWEEQYIPIEHKINGRNVGRHNFMKIKIGDPNIWTTPIAISNNVTNIETVIGDIQDDNVTFTFTIKLIFTDGNIVESEPITIKNGIDGTKIVSAVIDVDGYLIMTYSDGTIINAGHTKGQDAIGLPPGGPDDYILSTSAATPVWISALQTLNLALQVTFPIEYDFLTGVLLHNLDDGNRHIPIGGTNGALLATDGVGNYTWELLDNNLKSPDDYDAALAGGLYPTIWKGRAVEEGDTFYMTTAGTIGVITANIGDMLVSKTNNPGQVDANWFLIESNRDQATETILGVSKIATQLLTDAGLNDTNYITPLKLATSSKWSDYYTKLELQGDGLSQVHWNNLTNIVHTGDVTGDANLTIQPDTVTYDKMQDMTIQGILGRLTVAGTIEELSTLPSNVMSNISIISSQISNLSFLILPDTPSTYLSKAGKAIVVNSSENGVEFRTVSSVATVGIGGDYATISAALAANKYDLKLISNVIETAAIDLTTITNIDTSIYSIDMGGNTFTVTGNNISVQNIRLSTGTILIDTTADKTIVTGNRTQSAIIDTGINTIIQGNQLI